VDGTLIGVANGGDIFRAQIGCPETAFVPAIQQVGSYLCTYTFGTVQWFLNGEPIPDGNDLCVEATAAGNYNVVVTEGPGCVSAPSATVQMISTGVQAVLQDKTRLFPNPTSDLVSIDRMGNSPAVVTVIDAQGRMVGSDHMNGGSAAIDVQDLPPGLYLVHIASVAGVECLRLVKE
jgi:hypothetical protein